MTLKIRCFLYMWTDFAVLRTNPILWYLFISETINWEFRNKLWALLHSKNCFLYFWTFCLTLQCWKSNPILWSLFNSETINWEFRNKLWVLLYSKNWFLYFWTFFLTLQCWTREQSSGPDDTWSQEWRSLGLGFVRATIWSKHTSLQRPQSLELNQRSMWPTGISVELYFKITFVIN